MWDLIVSVPDHCLSFYFPYRKVNDASTTCCSLIHVVSVCSHALTTVIQSYITEQPVSVYVLL